MYFLGTSYSVPSSIPSTEPTGHLYFCPRVSKMHYFTSVRKNWNRNRTLLWENPRSSRSFTTQDHRHHSSARRSKLEAPRENTVSHRWLDSNDPFAAAFTYMSVSRHVQQQKYHAHILQSSQDKEQTGLSPLTFLWQRVNSNNFCKMFAEKRRGDSLETKIGILTRSDPKAQAWKLYSRSLQSSVWA